MDPHPTRFGAPSGSAPAGARVRLAPARELAASDLAATWPPVTLSLQTGRSSWGALLAT